MSEMTYAIKDKTLSVNVSFQYSVKGYKDGNLYKTTKLTI